MKKRIKSFCKKILSKLYGHKVPYPIALILGKMYFHYRRKRHYDITAYPGWFMLQICPDFIARQTKKLSLILVTGTNGKTSVCRSLHHILKLNGISCFCSFSGANLPTGVASTLLEQCNIFGRYNVKYGILECDEAAFPSLAPCFKSKKITVVVNNLFPDQLDRYGSPDMARNDIHAALEALPQATVYLNADCPATASLSEDLPNSIYYFGMDFAGCSIAAAVSGRCPLCGHPLTYRHFAYGEMGDYSCSACGYERPTPLLSQPLSSDTPHYKQYNQLAISAALHHLQLSCKVDTASLQGLQNPGRSEVFHVPGCGFTLQLVKNAVGYQQSIAELPANLDNCAVVFALNDESCDGRDISWIWSCDFEPLLKKMSDNTKIGVCGTRAADMAVRLKYAGIEPNSILVSSSFEPIFTECRSGTKWTYVFSNYSALFPIRWVLNANSKKEEPCTN